MIDGSKCRHLNEDLFSFTSMIPGEEYPNQRANYSSEVILATEPPTRTATYSYMVTGQLQSATNENGTVYLGYDSRYRVNSVFDPFNYGVSYNYDAVGNRTKLSLNGATYATYTYDAANRLANLADGGGQNFPHTYDAANRLTSRTAPNGVTTSYSYDGLNRLLALTHTAGAATLIANQYQYNEAGDLTNWVNASGNHAYGYDLLNRLTTAAHTSQPAESYTYDVVGNRTASQSSAAYSYQPFNRLTATDAASYSYDNNGNLISKTDGTGTTTFTWSEENRLTQVSLPTGVTVNYKYDALGRRIQRTTSAGANERYVYDGREVLLDLNADWTVQDTYLNDLGIDNHLRQTSAATGMSYFLADHLGSTSGLADSAGNLAEQISYDSFGNGAGSARTRYGYAGRERDADTGLYYYRARFYDPQMGRFIAEDPIGFAGGDVNWFGYVWSNPLKYSDPTGLDGWGNDTADWLDGQIDKAQQYWHYNDQEWVANGVNNTVADVAHGAADMFRAGSGIGHAIYDCDDNGYGRAANVAQDVVRITGLFQLLAGPFARVGSGNCFVAGTLVQTADGTKRIEEIKAGDVVLSTDAGQSAPAGQAPQRQSVTQIFARTVTEVVDVRAGGETITATPEHPFWVIGAGWTAAGELRRGSALLTKDGVVIHVDSVERREGKFQVYNFEVASAHTYYVSRLGLLVHNSCGTLQPGPYADESIPARGPQRDFTAQERADINRIGQETGCHTCGTKDPGTKSGNFVLDHQPANQLNPNGEPQRLYPHCLHCSQVQGGEVRAATRP